MVKTEFHNEEEIKREVKRYKRFLKKDDVSENTIISYCWTLEYFLSTYRNINTNTVIQYKNYLIANFAPTTANQRMQAMNKYFAWNNIKQHMKSVKVQQKPFLENVISMQDYKFVKRKLKEDEKMIYYFLIWGMACTGARISEILKVKVEHIVDGQMDFYGKGRKNRRIYFVNTYRKEFLTYLEEVGQTTGYVFISKDKTVLTTKGVEKQLKSIAREYGIDEGVMYPHSFRHLYGKTFYDKYKDLPLLADLMGHSSIETTRVYTRRTSLEQRKIIEKVVTW